MVLAVDFTVMGCPIFDATIPQCRGPAPLTLTFVPITSGAVTRFLWDFGDLSKSFEALPTHTYTQPESYDVSLLGAPALAMQTRKAFVVVTPNPLGGACDLERQCETGLTCLCGLASQCPSAFPRGVCTQPCSAGGACPENAFCADLSLGSETSTAPTAPPGGAATACGAATTTATAVPARAAGRCPRRERPNAGSGPASTASPASSAPPAGAAPASRRRTSA